MPDLAFVCNIWHRTGLSTRPEVVGHESVETTQIYLEATLAMKEKRRRPWRRPKCG
jgi:hypothetical protein